jgi:hypothetical protein
MMMAVVAVSFLVVVGLMVVMYLLWNGHTLPSSSLQQREQEHPILLWLFGGTAATALVMPGMRDGGLRPYPMLRHPHRHNSQGDTAAGSRQQTARLPPSLRVPPILASSPV